MLKLQIYQYTLNSRWPWAFSFQFRNTLGIKPSIKLEVQIIYKWYHIQFFFCSFLRSQGTWKILILTTPATGTVMPNACSMLQKSLYIILSELIQKLHIGWIRWIKPSLSHGYEFKHWIGDTITERFQEYQLLKRKANFCHSDLISL